MRDRHLLIIAALLFTVALSFTTQDSTGSNQVSKFVEGDSIHIKVNSH